MILQMGIKNSSNLFIISNQSVGKMIHFIKDKNKNQTKVLAVVNGIIYTIAKFYKEKTKWKLEMFSNKQYNYVGSFDSKKKLIEAIDTFMSNDAIYKRKL